MTSLGDPTTVGKDDGSKAASAAVRWEELLPAEFDQRLAASPIVYLPLGLCEPHGHAAPFGLDTLKAEFLCNEAARRFGGIVAPTLAYQIHESGYHGPWLREVIGKVNPRLAALPPHIVLEAFLYQLRSFRNAGFSAVVAVSGHAGGNEVDLRMVADAFAKTYPIEYFVCADPELVKGKFSGDHAGRYELSQLLAIRPDLIKMERVGRARLAEFGRLGQNSDAHEATAAMGRAILEAQLTALGEAVGEFHLVAGEAQFISLEGVEPIWASIASQRNSWRTTNL